jgi:hypothetical protein
VAQWVRSLDLTTHISLSPIRRGFAPSFVNDKKGAPDSLRQSDKVYQLLAHGRWFFPGSKASSTTKTGHHDIAEILLKVALNTKIQIHSNVYIYIYIYTNYRRGPTKLHIHQSEIFHETRKEPPTMGKQLVNFITCRSESGAPFLSFTKFGANPRRIGDRLVWVVRSNDLTHWATRAPIYMCGYVCLFYFFLIITEDPTVTVNIEMPWQYFLCCSSQYQTKNDVSKKGYGCIWTIEIIQHYT